MSDTIYLIRHGQSTWNAEGKHQGWANAPLSDLGRQQSMVTGKRLAVVSFDQVISSPTFRALQTAQLLAGEIGFGGEITTDPNLRDARRSAAKEGGAFNKEEIAAIRADLDYKFPDGESSREFVARTGLAFARIEAALTGDSNVLVVTHGMNVKVLILYAINLIRYLDENPYLINHAMRMSNCSISSLLHDAKWVHEGGSYRLTSYNDTGHIDLSGLPTSVNTANVEP